MLDVVKPKDGFTELDLLLKAAGLTFGGRDKLKKRLVEWGQPFYILAAAEVAEQKLGSRLLPFEYVTKLGEGTFGRVYQLKRRGDGSGVALKDQLGV